jgi:hypothetical protein
MLVLVNRHRQKPIRLRSKPLWQQPAYLLRMRGGKYLCACCSLEDGVLTLYPESQEPGYRLRLRNRWDAEVVGQVAAIARRIPCPVPVTFKEDMIPHHTVKLSGLSSL